MSRFASSTSRSGYPATTATARVADNLALYGHTPHADEPEFRPMPDDAVLDGAVASLFGSIIDPFADTALEPDTADLLWSLADVLHRKGDRVQRFLDDNELKQRASQDEQDGSEIRSVELERLVDKGKLLLEKRAAFERMRDEAALRYEDHTGSPWRPRSGSMVNHKTMTAAVVDSRDYINAKRIRETEVLIPAGTRIAFSGGYECNDVDGIWKVLDSVHAKYPDMVLLYTDGKVGADRIAASWAASRKVVPIGFPPRKQHAADRAAPFKRNDLLLDAMPIGLVVFPGNGITDNLADKATARGVKLIDMRKGAKGGA